MQWEIIYFPILLLIIMIMAMGFGLLVSSLTTKYRDLKFLIDFAVPHSKIYVHQELPLLMLFLLKLYQKTWCFLPNTTQ